MCSLCCAGLLGRHNGITSEEIIQSDVLAAMLSLIGSVKHKSQLAGLQVIAGLALTSEAAAQRLLTPEVLQVWPLRGRCAKSGSLCRWTAGQARWVHE